MTTRSKYDKKVNMKKRIDIALVEKGLARSRTQAAELVHTKKVVVGGVIVEKPSLPVDDVTTIEVTEQLPFVGRGGLKLEKALEVFDIDVKGLAVADIGASTGGFTDCVLQRGAEKVFAIDVGRDQLVPELRNDPRVISMEETDVRTVELPLPVDLAVVDVSFISVTKILPRVKSMLKEKGSAVILIKPQFEVGKGKLGKNGVVTDEKLRSDAVETVVKKSEELGLVCKAVIPSPVLGGAGNKEYLAHLLIKSN
ncbi:MAG: TlyA family RNA methyltransferase [Candidatus Paceibacterota bacterium]|jgi:23S rRNA (cytidine1920-2'-O)/16S rRNA (cytidine1409-2'-O)-methyltransferase